jgi:hypothetical protein
MSAIATRIRAGCIARLARNPRAEEISPAADTPYRLLWSTGIAAFVLGIAAFVLWGLNGAGTLFDLIATFCT